MDQKKILKDQKKIVRASMVCGGIKKRILDTNGLHLYEKIHFCANRWLFFFLIPIYGAHWDPLKPWASWASLSSPGPPPGPPWELRTKKKIVGGSKKNSRDVHVSHASNTVNYRVFGVWGPKNIVIYSVLAPPDRVDYGRVGRPPTMVGTLAGQA